MVTKGKIIFISVLALYIMGIWGYTVYGKSVVTKTLSDNFLLVQYSQGKAVNFWSLTNSSVTIPSGTFNFIDVEGNRVYVKNNTVLVQIKKHSNDGVLGQIKRYVYKDKGHKP